MTNEAWIKRQTKTPEARREYEQERLILWTTETIAAAMEQKGLAKAQIAEILGTSRSHITQLLSGSRNMTLRSLADLSFACGMRADVMLEPMDEDRFMAFPLRLVGRPRPRRVQVEPAGEMVVPEETDSSTLAA